MVGARRAESDLHRDRTRRAGLPGDVHDHRPLREIGAAMSTSLRSIVTAAAAAAMLLLATTGSAQPAVRNECAVCHAGLADARLSAPAASFAGTDVHRERGF